MHPIFMMDDQVLTLLIIFQKHIALKMDSVRIFKVRMAQIADICLYIINFYKYSSSSSTSPSVIVENAPLNFVRNGWYYYLDCQLGGRGTGGDYWSTTAYSSTNSRFFGFVSSSFYPQDDFNKGDGFSVR